MSARFAKPLGIHPDLKVMSGYLAGDANRQRSPLLF